MTFPDGNHRRQGKNPHGRPHGRPPGAGPRHAPHHPRRPHQPHPAPHPNQLPYGLPVDPGESEDWIHPGGTGEEAAYLKGLVDSHTKVTVVLTDGERFRGHIRYYDRDCFSIGLSAQGPRLLVRKEHVACIVED